MKKIMLRLTTVLLILSLLGSLNAPVAANSAATPERVHLTWQTDDTAHTMTITWWTPTENAGDKIFYDTVSRDGVIENYSHSKTGNHHTFTGFNGYIHDVKLTNLSPDTTYYFVCGGENGGYSQEWSFQTAPTTSKNLKFAAGGDSRQLYEGEGRPSDFPENRDLLSQEMAARNPAFAIYTGDFVLDSNSGDQWENWFDAMQKYWVTSENRIIPIIPTIGNHEITYPQPQKYSPENDAPYYYEQFTLPENERWYSLDWGPDLHITILDSEIQDTTSEVWDEQKSWLENDLSQHENFKWKIVAFHRPPFSSDSSHGSKIGIRKEWAGLFYDYGVDLVINGHAHDYERTHPIKYSKEEGPEVKSSSKNGTIYVISGGWGAPTYAVGASNWTATAWRRQHILFFNVSASDNTLSMSAIDASGKEFDNITLPYGEEGAPSFPSIPLPLAIAAAAIFLVGVGVYFIKGGKSREEPYPYEPQFEEI